MRVASLADTLPVPAEAVTCELARVVAQADVDMAAIAKEVVDAVRNNDAGSPTGKVMVERQKWLLRPHAALAKELSEMFFCLGIEGKHGVTRGKVLGLQFGDPQELGVPIRAVAACQNLLNLVSSQFLRFHPVLYDRRADGRSHVPHRVRNLPRREVRPQHIFLVGIPGGADLQNRF